MPIAAHFEHTADVTGQPRDPRRTLRLDAQGATGSGSAADVLIHNISTTGMLLESTVALAIDERIEIDLPEIGGTWAHVIWSSGNLSGCQFDTPISAAALSAAQLRGHAEQAMDITLAPQSRPDESFGTRLHRMRKERGLTLSQIAAQLGVSKPTVWAWEQGKARPVDSRIDALAEAMGVSRAEILSGTSNAALRDLIARCREQIANVVGTTVDKIRIMIEL